jgi:hypothetical protein
MYLEIQVTKKKYTVVNVHDDIPDIFSYKKKRRIENYSTGEEVGYKLIMVNYSKMSDYYKKTHNIDNQLRSVMIKKILQS